MRKRCVYKNSELSIDIIDKHSDPYIVNVSGILPVCAGPLPAHISYVIRTWITLLSWFMVRVSVLDHVRRGHTPAARSLASFFLTPFIIVSRPAASSGDIGIW